MFLSHAATTIRPSMLSPNATVSMESAMTSRLTSDAFMPSVPMDIPSLIVIVPNMKGTLFASQTPSFTFFASRSRWTLQGVTSLARLPIATKGLSMSSSPSPTARSMERAGALSGPSLTARLWRLRSTFVSATMFILHPVGLPGGVRSTRRGCCGSSSWPASHPGRTPSGPPSWASLRWRAVP